MRLEKREHPEAREELREAAYWYDDREPGLGENFYDAIDEAIARIVAVFPYRVLYYLTETSFVILAYAHERRRPRYWQHRLDS